MTRLPNIIFIRSNPCNPDVRVQKEINAILKLGGNITLLAWDRDNSIDSTIKSDINITRFGIKAGYGMGLKSLLSLARFNLKVLIYLFKNRKFIDIIHSCDFDTIIPAFLIAKLFRKIIIYDIFDYYSDAYNVPKALKPLIRRIDTSIINNVSSCIICTNERIEQIAPAKPKILEVIHNSPPPLNIQSQKIKSDKITIAYIGTFCKERYIEELLDIVSKESGFELHIAGFGYLESLVKSYANKYSNIIFYGKVSYTESLKLSYSCDIMIAMYEISNRNHRFAAPNKFYESLMLGKPLLMIKGSGMSEVLRKYNIGEAIVFSKQTLREAIYSLKATNSKAKEALRKKLYKEIFSWDISESRLISLYKRLWGGVFARLRLLLKYLISPFYKSLFGAYL